MCVKKAEFKIASIKNTCANVINDVNEREKNAKEKQEYYDKLIRQENKKIEQTANKKVADKIAQLEGQYKLSMDANRAFWDMILAFSFILTLLLALKDKVFVSDFVNCLEKIVEGINSYIEGYSGGVVNVLGMIIVTVFVIGIMFIGIYFFATFLRDNDMPLCDRGTSIITYMLMVIIMFAGTIIKERISINLIGLYVLALAIIYPLRCIVLMKDHDTRKELVITVLGVVFVMAMIIIGVKSCVVALNDLAG